MQKCPVLVLNSYPDPPPPPPPPFLKSCIRPCLIQLQDAPRILSFSSPLIYPTEKSIYKSHLESTYNIMNIITDT